MPRRKPFIYFLFMLPYPAFEATGYSGIKDGVYFIGDNINIVDVVFH